MSIEPLDRPAPAPRSQRVPANGSAAPVRRAPWFDWSLVAIFAVCPVLWDLCVMLGAPARADQVMRFAVYGAIALVAARVVLGASDALTPALRTQRAGRSALFAGAAAGVLTEAVGLHWVLFSNAVPALRHDWTWPISSLELQRLGAISTQGWVAGEGFGSPKAFPTLYAMDVPLALLGRVLDSHAVLMFALLLMALVAGISMNVLLYRTFGLHLTGTLAATVAYVASPFAFDEFSAGHLPNVLAFALLPLVPALVLALAGPAFGDGRARVGLGVVLGLTVAISAAQIQYVLFDALAVLLALAVRPRIGPRLVPVAATALLVVAGAHGQSFAHLLGPGNHGSRAASISPAEWFFTLSKPLPPTLAQSGYIGGYADANRLLPPDFQLALLATLTWFAAGFALWRGGRAGLFFTLALVAGLMGATGVYGPFAAFKLALSNLRAMTALREAYNFQCLTTLGIAGCIALAAGAGAGAVRFGHVVRAGAWVLAFVGAYAWLCGGTAAELHLRAEGQSEASARAVLAADMSDARVAMLPMVEPIRQDNYAYGGSEPYWAGFGGHPIITEFEPEPAFATAAVLLRQSDPSAGIRLLGRLGVRYFVLRNDLVSDLPQYWFPSLFPPNWSTRDDYAHLEASPLLAQRFADPSVEVYEVKTYEPPLSFAKGEAGCAGATLMLAYAQARGAVAPCAHIGQTAAMTPLDPDGTTFDPAKAWVSATKLFPLGTAFASSPGALGTTAAVAHTLHVRLRRGDDVALPCIARHAPLVSLDGGPFRALDCGRKADGNVRWTLWPHAALGDDTLTLVGRGGFALVGPAASGARLSRPDALTRVDYLVPERPAASESLDYERIEPGLIRGHISTPRAATIVFSDTYDDRWALHLGDLPPLQSVRVNGFENRFTVPAGSRDFTLRFEPAPFDRFLDVLQGLTWPLCLLVLGATQMLLRRDRRDRRDRGTA